MLNCKSYHWDKEGLHLIFNEKITVDAKTFEHVKRDYAIHRKEFTEFIKKSLLVKEYNKEI